MAGTRRTEMTRLLFRTALVELMQKKSFSKISITEICEQADLNRTTFYLHYSDQQALLKDVVQDVLERTEKYLRGNGKHKNMAEFLTDYLEYIRTNAQNFHTLMCGDISSEARAVLIEGLLKDMKEEWPNYGPPMENDYTYTFIMQGSMHVIIRWIERGFDLSSKELAALILQLVTKV